MKKFTAKIMARLRPEVTRTPWVFAMILGCTVTISQYQSYMIADMWCADKAVVIQLSDFMEEASDITCMEAADLFHTITTQGYTLFVKPYRTGGWIPSRVNPMTEAWTKRLVENRTSIAKPPKAQRSETLNKNGVTVNIVPDGRKPREKPERRRQESHEITVTITK